MRAARTSLSFLLFATLVASAGCDGCAEAPATPDEDDRSGLPPNTGEGDEDPAPEARDLRFDGASPVDVFYGQQAVLPFTLTTRSGAKVSAEAVSFVLEGQGGSLNVSSSNTDAAGVARVTFTAGSADATVTVRASAEHAEDAVATVRVKVNPVGSLKVTVTSQTRIPLARSEVLVFRGPAQNTPTCAYLDTATTLPTAGFAAEFTTHPSTRTFTDQPHNNAVTVLASGYNAAGDLIGTGCTDGSAIVGGTTTNVSIAIQQLPSILAGDYDVLMNVDLGLALPEPYEGYVDMVTGILSDPAGYAVYQSLRQLYPDWDFVGYDVDGDGNSDRVATWREVSENPNEYNTWSMASSILDTMLTDQLGQTYVTVTTVGGDVRQAITDFEVGTRFAFTPVAGVENVYDVSEQWNDLVFTWSLNCPAGDTGCARRAVQLDDTNYAPVATHYTAAAAHRPLTTQSERFEITTEPHLFALRYGAIIMIAMNEVVFPSLPYQASQGEQPAHSLVEVLHNIIECPDVGTAIANAIGFGSPGFYASLCDAGLGYAASSIENRVLELEVGSGNPELGPKEQTGALGGGIMYLVDGNKNLATEMVQELQMQVQWNDDENGASTDVLAPILGAGREAASGCDADAACDAGTYCQPVPHYLKVKAVEMTCGKPVGQGLGEDACTADNQCASGVCVGDSQGVPGTCFAACTASNNACGLGVCTDAAAFMNLDPVMAGLGDAAMSSCMIPE